MSEEDHMATVKNRFALRLVVEFLHAMSDRERPGLYPGPDRHTQILKCDTGIERA